ncbi:hypothetical protein CMO91_03275, partial [Candidatus Woesearchaeota archaeon]|nr:hypothetical protein [Candidatus Woesearchaeota archaeon]
FTSSRELYSLTTDLTGVEVSPERRKMDLRAGGKFTAALDIKRSNAFVNGDTVTLVVQANRGLESETKKAQRTEFTFSVSAPSDPEEAG